MDLIGQIKGLVDEAKGRWTTHAAAVDRCLTPGIEKAPPA